MWSDKHDPYAEQLPGRPPWATPETPRLTGAGRLFGGMVGLAAAWLVSAAVWLWRFVDRLTDLR